MVEIFKGARPATPQYYSEPISIQFHGTLLTASLPPKEILFEQEIARKLKIVAYQDPQKVSAGLSYIWEEKDKWVKIGNRMGWNPDMAKTKLKLIVDRRNAIVHESDLDPISGTKNLITRAECKDVTDFIELCGKSIADLVI
jgi:hypothetical protein